jgi:hypothetical protein
MEAQRLVFPCLSGGFFVESGTKGQKKQAEQQKIVLQAK